MSKDEADERAEEASPPMVGGTEAPKPRLEILDRSPGLRETFAEVWRGLEATLRTDMLKLEAAHRVLSGDPDRIAYIARTMRGAEEHLENFRALQRMADDQLQLFQDEMGEGFDWYMEMRHPEPPQTQDRSETSPQ